MFWLSLAGSCSPSLSRKIGCPRRSLEPSSRTMCRATCAQLSFWPPPPAQWEGSQRLGCNRNTSKWVWVKNRHPKWNPNKGKEGLEPSVFLGPDPRVEHRIPSNGSVSVHNQTPLLNCRESAYGSPRIGGPNPKQAAVGWPMWPPGRPSPQVKQQATPLWPLFRVRAFLGLFLCGVCPSTLPLPPLGLLRFLAARPTSPSPHGIPPLPPNPPPPAFERAGLRMALTGAAGSRRSPRPRNRSTASGAPGGSARRRRTCRSSGRKAKSEVLGARKFGSGSKPMVSHFGW